MSFDFFFRHEKIDPESDRQLSPALRAPLAVFVGLPELRVSVAFDTLLLPFDLAFWLSDQGATGPEDEETPGTAVAASIGQAYGQSALIYVATSNWDWLSFMIGLILVRVERLGRAPLHRLVRGRRVGPCVDARSVAMIGPVESPLETGTSRHLLAAFIFLATISPPSRAQEPCGTVLPVETIEQLVLRSSSTLRDRMSVRPGATGLLTLGVIECCVLLRPVDACATWTAEPDDFVTIEMLRPGDEPFGASARLRIDPAAPHGAVIVVRVNVEEGRRILESEVFVYRPEENPFVGFVWREDSQISCAPGFLRGDVDQSGSLDQTDAIALLGFLFLGTGPPVCLAASDANSDDVPDLSDAVYILSHAFLGGAPPGPPFPACGPAFRPGPLTCAQPACLEALIPDPPIEELIFEADGTFRVTWTPFEVFVDYWGTYQFDLERGEIQLDFTFGNTTPLDFDGGPGRFSFEGDSLRLEQVWLGTRGKSGRQCGHVLRPAG